jgi:hypothetical protein
MWKVGTGQATGLEREREACGRDIGLGGVRDTGIGWKGRDREKFRGDWRAERERKRRMHTHTDSKRGMVN